MWGSSFVEAARRMFPISRRREDTFIGGISMGAYGALRNGFKYAENFGGIIALSSAMSLGRLRPPHQRRRLLPEPQLPWNPPLRI